MKLLRFLPHAIGLLLGLPSYADNIFDDGWAPPERAKTPAVKPEKPAKTPPAVTPRPVEPIQPPAAPVIPPAKIVTVAPTKRDVPAQTDQLRSRALLREAYSKELSEKGLVGRRALAEQLLRDAKKNDANPTDQFVILTGAFEAAREGADLLLCFRVVETLDAVFRVDAVQWEALAAVKVAYRADPAKLEDNIRAALRVVDHLAAEEDFAGAGKLIAALQSASQGQVAVVKDVQARSKALSAGKAAFDQTRRDRDVLATAPDDPAANLSVGRYLCFNQRSWSEGLLLLAKCADPAIKEAALAELAAPAAEGDIAALGDRWWSLAEKQSDAHRPSVMLHAAELYRRAVPAITGLRKSAMEKRIALAEIEAGVTAPARATAPTVAAVNPKAIGGQATAGAALPAQVTAVAKMIEGKRDAKELAGNVLAFQAPNGDGRRGALGITLPADASFATSGSVWRFHWSRAGSALGVQIIHPIGKGQVIIHLKPKSIGISSPQNWWAQGTYRSGDTKAVQHEAGYEKVFPLADDQVYSVESRLLPDGRYGLKIDGQLVATAGFREANSLVLENPAGPPAAGGKNPGEFKPAKNGPEVPLKWEPGRAGLLIEPLDNGHNKASDVEFGPMKL